MEVWNAEDACMREGARRYEDVDDERLLNRMEVERDTIVRRGATIGIVLVCKGNSLLRGLAAVVLVIMAAL
jgi:hypothetical protein